jgi:2-amino-4-hydroxy-6-hydroxymethyldihydropteridine diphosphokinase
MPDGETRGSGSTGEWVVVALGSNLGDSREVLRKAMDRLQALSEDPVIRSSMWRTAPMDCPPGSADFVNAVVAWARRPGQMPEALIESLQTIEREFGRRPKEVRNEPRPLDLDLIAFGREQRRTERLILPHPRAAGRAFVLYPLAEILPDLVLSGQARTVRELRDDLDVGGKQRVEKIDGGGQGRGSAETHPGPAG